MYDDNITYQRDASQKDSITQLTAGLGLRLEGKLNTFAVSGNSTQQIFAEHSRYDNNAQDAALRLGSEFSPYTSLDVRDNFVHAEEPRSFEDALGRGLGRYSYYRNRFSVDLGHDLSEHVRFDALYGNDFDKLMRPDLADSTLNRGGAEAHFIPTPALDLSASYEFSDRLFTTGAESTAHNAGLGLRKELTQQAAFEGKGGMSFIKGYNGALFEKPFVSLALTDDVSERSKAKLAYSKEYSANPFAQDLFNYWETSARIDHELGERFTGTLSGFYGRGEYVDLNIEDKLWGGNVGLDYALTQFMKIGAAYTYASVESTDATRAYVKDTVAVKLEAEY